MGARWGCRSDGVIYREQMGEPDDIRLPKFSKIKRMDYGEFLTAVKDGQTSTVEMWRDKEPYWFPPWRQYFKGQRAVVTLKNGVRVPSLNAMTPLATLIGREECCKSGPLCPLPPQGVRHGRRAYIEIERVSTRVERRGLSACHRGRSSGRQGRGHGRRVTHPGQ